MAHNGGRLIGESDMRMNEHLDHHDNKSAKAAAIGASAVGAVAVGSIAFGAIAVGAIAVGALAIGRLFIRRLGADYVRFKTLEIEELKVTRIQASEIVVHSSLELPGSDPKRPLKFDPAARLQDESQDSNPHQPRARES